MPVIKVPIVHKFGIISHSQRLELQERLLKEALAKTAEKADGTEATKNPFEISDDFIKRYNLAQNTPEAEYYESQAKKILFRVKRRVGLKTGCVGPHVNIPYAWTELTLLAQCKGPLYEECLNILLLSLDQAPIGAYQIAALFYLAETVLYWLQTDAAQQTILRASEIKLLKIGELVFYRLYYHNMSGHLHNEEEAKSRLAVYLEGFEDYEESYDPYPYTHLSFSYINCVGKSLTAGLRPKEDQMEIKKDSEHDDSSTAVIPGQRETQSAVSVTSEVHRLSPLLWHGLDVWRCSVGQGGDLKEALRALWKCLGTIRQQNWIDAYVAVAILTDASKVNMDCLRFAQAFLEEVLFDLNNKETEASKNECSSKDIESTKKESSENACDQWTCKVAVSMILQLGHVTLHASTSQLRQTALVGTPRVSLVELVNFQKTESGQEVTWSWRIRYTALLALVTISEATLDDPIRECLRNLSLDTIGRTQAKERDQRVLEAIKIGRINTDLEKQINDLLKTSRPTFLNFRVSQSLSSLYLPPLPSPVSAITSTPGRTLAHKKRQGVRQPSDSRQTSGDPRSGAVVRTPQTSEPSLPSLVGKGSQQTPEPPLSKFRTTLNEEIELAKSLDGKPAGFYQRQDFSLFRVVEDQWRKDLHMQMEVEEEERNAELLAKHEENQKKMSKIQAYKDRRLKKGTTITNKTNV